MRWLNISRSWGLFWKIMMKPHFSNKCGAILPQSKYAWYCRCSPSNKSSFSHKHPSMKHDRNFYSPSKDKYVVVCFVSSSFLCRRTFFSLWRTNPMIIKHGGKAHSEKAPLPSHLQKHHQNVLFLLGTATGVWEGFSIELVQFENYQSGILLPPCPPKM